MMRLKKHWLWLLLMMVNSSFLLSQEAPPTRMTPDTSFNVDTLYTVGNIQITGNKKTKKFIILREIPFKEGEEYPLRELVKKFEDARRQLMNTVLFHSVIVAAQSFEGYKINILVEVKERWYLFPSPYFKPVDRNLNQWIVEQNADLSRVNYGIRFRYNNATGVNDKIKGSIGGGYTRQFSLSYDRLYIDKRLQWGFAAGFSAGKNKEVNYNTVNNKQAFVKDDNVFLSNYSNAYALVTYRRKIKTRHSFGFSYASGEVHDTIISLNPTYFKNGIRKIRYPGLFYNITYFDLDYIPYPTKGYAVDASFSKKGFGGTIDLWQFAVKGLGSWRLSDKMFFNLNIYGALKLPFRQPYFNQQFLGYGDVYMQGYEYYVVDGVAGGYLKATLYREFLNFRIRIPPIKKGKDPTHIPFRIIGKAFGNSGYVHNPQPGNNFLSNKMLYSGGFGIDIVSFYDITFKLEYSFNQLGENGLFLHKKSIF